MEAQLEALKDIGIIIGSFLVGFAFFYVTSPFTKEVKKRVLDQTISMLINFVIYVWIGKILLNIGLFVRDPLAVLAYPSDSSAFYAATLLILIHIIWKVWRKKMTDTNLLVGFMPIFLAASFIYEFIQMFWFENSYSLMYIGMLTILIIIFLLVQDKIAGWQLSLYLFMLWSLGQIILSFILPFATVFSYIMSPWYLFIVLLLSIGLYFYLFRLKKR